jgi:carboxylesterase
VEAFGASRRGEWLACARQELEEMRARHRVISIGGLSMGGALASILAAESRELSALVLIAPYLDMPVTHRVASASHWMWGSIAGVRKTNSPRSILDPDERKKNLGYGAYTARLLYELWRLAAEARRSLPSITAPALLIQSREDPRIAPQVAERAFAAIGAKEKKLCWIEGGGHIITVDFGREKVFAEVTEWLELHGGVPGSN